jgi:hypothetical protein
MDDHPGVDDCDIKCFTPLLVFFTNNMDFRWNGVEGRSEQVFQQKSILSQA